MKRLWKLARDAEGAEIAEAALVLPIVFTLLLGIFWVGRAYNVYATVNHAAREGARAAVAPVCASCSQSMCNGQTTAFPCDSVVVDAVNSALRASKLDPTQVTPAPPITSRNCPAPAPPPKCSATSNKVLICRNVLLNPASAPEECGTVVTFKYPFQFYLPFTPLNQQQLSLTARAQMRMEY